MNGSVFTNFGASTVFDRPVPWLIVTPLLLMACVYLPLKIKNDALRNLVMRWVLVPVSLVIIIYVYPIGIEIFRRLALTNR